MTAILQRLWREDEENIGLIMPIQEAFIGVTEFASGEKDNEDVLKI